MDKNFKTLMSHPVIWNVGGLGLPRDRSDTLLPCSSGAGSTIFFRLRALLTGREGGEASACCGVLDPLLSTVGVDDGPDSGSYND